MINNENNIDVQNKIIGENGHLEHNWSIDIREKILQFSFQVTRTSEEKIESLSIKLQELLYELKCNINYFPTEVSELVTVLYKMIGNTRDIVSGKGEYSLAYMMIYVWNIYFPELALLALEKFVLLKSNDDNNINVHPYGSWKDMKYFCNYCRQKGMSEKDSLIKKCIQLINDQLLWDANDCCLPTLLAKWVPREKSKKFGWLFKSLACHYFSSYLKTATTKEQMKKAILKCKTEYRKLISNINVRIFTVQINQCANNWKNIDFDNVTSITMNKQKRAFLNSKNSELEDRIICANNLKEKIQNTLLGKETIKGKRVGLNDFTKEALNLIQRKEELLNDLDINKENLQLEIDMLNSQWEDSSKDTGVLKNMIAMVDVSGSMDGDPLNAAISLGIRVSDKSLFGKRVMTFSSQPKWVDLSQEHTYFDKVCKLKHADWGMNTNFYAAFNLILEAITDLKMDPKCIENLILVIFSDMQIDAAVKNGENTESMYENIERKFSETGIRVYGEPLKPPSILFWNLRSTNGFPCLLQNKNVSMMSGFNPSLLNLFCEGGVNSFQSMTPWNQLMNSLNHERYKSLEEEVKKFL